jgi:hypothetical protein
MKITTGINNFEIISSGTVISYKDETVNFELNPTLTFKMKFIKDAESKEQNLDFKIIDNTSVEILLTNFNNTLGTGNIEPLMLATIDKKNIYLNFVIHALGNSDTKTIHYTWYSREEVVNE